MTRAATEFKLAAERNNIKRWVIHECSMCGYPCGYIIHSEDNVWYDSGCYCTGQGGGHQTNFQDMADHYNMQSSEVVKKKYDEFWKFPEIVEAAS